MELTTLETGLSKLELFPDRKSDFKASSRSSNYFSHDWSKGDECAESKNPMAIPAKLKEPLEVTYSYSITYVKDNNVKWASRWDYILDSMPHTDIQVSSSCAGEN